MKNYFRIMLGANSVYAQECYEGSFIGADFEIDQDLSGELPERFAPSNQKFIPIWIGKTRQKQDCSRPRLRIPAPRAINGKISL